MGSNPTRRNILSGLGAAASLAATSCSSPTVSTSDQQHVDAAVKGMPGRVNLICHGMMLFLWNESEKTKDEIEILLPEAPKHGKHEMHKIYFGGFLGVRNLLPQPPFYVWQPDRYSFKLTMTVENKAFEREKSLFYKDEHGPDPTKDVVLKDKGSGKNPKLEKKDKDRYSIIVPYPTRVRRFRIMDFTADGPPFKGTAAYDLGIKPEQMAGIHVFTYEDVDDGSVKFGDPSIDESKWVPVGSTSNGLNIHLYSQPDDRNDLPKPGNQDHIEKFNELVEYHLLVGGAKKLDLKDNNKRPKLLKLDPQEILPLEFGSLFELPNYPPEDGSEEDKLVTGAQPVECLQGWGT